VLDKRVEHVNVRHLTQVSVVLLQIELSAQLSRCEEHSFRAAERLFAPRKAHWRSDREHELWQLLHPNVEVGVRVEAAPRLAETIEVEGRDEVRVGSVDVGEVFEDHRDHKVEQHERANHLEGDEVRDGKPDAAVAGRLRTQAQLFAHHCFHHEPRPGVAGETLE